ncbi:MAG: hypothetical protein MZW92_51110 [Comamonadaceae bacterium]|nr:hypothetical protein [Comamonadaceae bacterium]
MLHKYQGRALLIGHRRLRRALPLLLPARISPMPTAIACGRRFARSARRTSPATPVDRRGAS